MLGFWNWLLKGAIAPTGDSRSSAVQKTAVFGPGLPHSVNLDPFVENLRKAEHRSKAPKCLLHLDERARTKITNDNSGTVDQWKALFIQIVTIAGEKHPSILKSIRRGFSSGCPCSSTSFAVRTLKPQTGSASSPRLGNSHRRRIWVWPFADDNR